MKTNWQPFRQLQTEGAYNYLTQLITLDALEVAHFEALGDERMLAIEHKTLRLLFHEATHWLDHVSTTWGQRSIVQIINAINARLRNSPPDFWRIALANAEIYRIHFPKYFTTIEEGIDTEREGKPWQAQLTSGLQFGPDGRSRPDRPILFYRFKNSLGRSICRTPISIAALTEANATIAESWIDLRYLQNLKEDERLLEGKLLAKASAERLYDPRLSAYSVAAHFVANKFGLEEGFTAYRLTAALGTLALNLPPSSFHSLRVPPFVNFDGRFKAFVKQGDRGFAFVVLVTHAPPLPDEFMEGEDLRRWIDQAATNAGLPNLATLDQMVRKEHENIKREIIDGPESLRAHALLDIGRRLYDRRGLYGCDVIMEPLLDDKTIVDLPPVVLGDFSLVQIGRPIKEANIANVAAWLKNADRYEREIDEFIEACMP